MVPVTRGRAAKEEGMMRRFLFKLLTHAHAVVSDMEHKLYNAATGLYREGDWK